MNVLTKDLLDQLAEPFPAEIIEFKPGAITKDKTKALALAYVEVRHYIDRLNKVVGADWSDEYQFIVPSGELISCGLTVCGVTRWDIGEKNSADVNTATSALAQSFKRACVKFGLGRHLYAIESVWVAYDGDRKQFTPQAVQQLKCLLSGDQPKPEPTNGKKKTKEEVIAANRRLLITRIDDLNDQLHTPDQLDPTWLKEATETELTAYGLGLRGRVDAEAE